MAGFTIHLAVAEEYIRNHKNDIINKEEFLKGVIAPDLTTDKSLTHYGISSSKVVLKDFLKEHKLDNGYWLGYYLHLVTDYYFYKEYFGEQIKKSKNRNVYNDYDVLNEMIIKKYNVKILEDIPEIKNSMSFKKGIPEVLKEEYICDFIETLGKIKILNDGEIEIDLSHKKAKY